MTAVLLAHLLSVLHGLAAALITVAVFCIAGVLMLPRRWQAQVRWPDNVVCGLTVYVLVCWVATTSRHIAVVYIALALGAAFWGVAALKFQWLQATFGTLHKDAEIRRRIAEYACLYVFAYLLLRPAAGPGGLALPPDGALNLVTFARYAKQLLMLGTPGVDFAASGDLHSPATGYLLAWHSLLFLGDPLDAAMPLLFGLAALFGAMTAELARSVFGLSWRAAIAIAAIAVCAPVFRWTLTTFSLGELLSATTALYLALVLGRAIVARSVDAPRIAGIAMGVVLLFFALWPDAATPGNIARGVVDVGRHFSLLALAGMPGDIPVVSKETNLISFGTLVVVPLVPLTWAAVVSALRRSTALDRLGVSSVDRRLVSALVVYTAAGVVVGNVAVQAVRGRLPVRVPGTWRQLSQVNRMPFRRLTMKVGDEPNGLSTALTLYYLPGRKAEVIGRGVSFHELPFENVSRQQPLFIQNFSCEGVGHADTVSIAGVGCLLMAPPSPTPGSSYPFNRPFLFLEFDRMSTRDPGGRWNTESTLNLRLTADPERTRLDREMYINFLVNAFLPAGVKPQRLVLRWGAGRRGEILVGDREWFSVPVGSGDWSGNRLWTVPIAIEFPDGRTILFQEVALTESARGTLATAVPPDR